MIAIWGDALTLLGWTLVHSLWEVAGILGLWWVACRALSPSTARVRYWLACLGLGAMVASIPGTFWVLASAGREARIQARVQGAAGLGVGMVSWEAGPAINTDGASAPTIAERIQRVAIWTRLNLSRLAPWLAAGWLFGLALRCARLAVLWRRLHLLRLSGLMAVGEDLDRLCQRLAEAMGIRRRVLLRSSAALSSPATFGWLKPVVVLPTAMLTGLPRQDLEAILWHELAHIRRGDWVVNLMQSVAENLLFFHPAALWLSATIRREREYCCDDLAVSGVGDPLTYAEALAAVARGRLNPQLPVLGAADGDTLVRIRRVLTGKDSAEGKLPLGVTGALVGLAILSLLAVGPALAGRLPSPPWSPLDPRSDSQLVSAVLTDAPQEAYLCQLVANVTRATGRDVQYPLTLAYSRIPLPVAATAATALEAIELEVGLIPGRRPDGSLVLLPSSYNPGDGLWTETTVSTLPHRLQTDDLPPDGKEWNQEILDRAMGSLIYLPASARESLEFGLGELEASLPPSFLLHHITVQADGSSSAGRHDLIVEFAGLVAEGDPGSHLRGIRRRLEQRLGGSDPQAIALGRIQNSSDAWPAMAFVLPIPPRGRP